LCLHRPAGATCINAKFCECFAATSPDRQKKSNDRAFTERPPPRAARMFCSPSTKQLLERFAGEMGWNRHLNHRDATGRSAHFIPSGQNDSFAFSAGYCKTKSAGCLRQWHDDHPAVNKAATLFSTSIPIGFRSQLPQCAYRLSWRYADLEGQ